MSFRYASEIALSKPYDQAKMQDHFDQFCKIGIDEVYFSDQAGASDKLLSVQDYLDAEAWRQVDASKVVPVIAARRKSWQQLELIMGGITQSGISRAFIVGGDDKSESSGPSSTEAIARFSGEIQLGAVIHPQADAHGDFEQKRATGAQFFVVQASYDHSSFDNWFDEWGADVVTSHDVMAVIIPPTSQRVVDILSGLKDVDVSQEFLNQFQTATDKQTFGIDYARDAVQKFAQMGLSGAYVYSRNVQTVTAVIAS